MNFFKERIIELIFSSILLFIGIYIKNETESRYVSVTCEAHNNEKKIIGFDRTDITVDSSESYCIIKFDNNKRGPIKNEKLVIDFSKDSAMILMALFENPEQTYLDSSTLKNTKYAVRYQIGELVKNKPVKILIKTKGNINQDSINFRENISFCRLKINNKFTRMSIIIKYIPLVTILIGSVLLLFTLLKYLRQKYGFNIFRLNFLSKKNEPHIQTKGLRSYLKHFFNQKT